MSDKPPSTPASQRDVCPFCGADERGRHTHAILYKCESDYQWYEGKQDWVWTRHRTCYERELAQVAKHRWAAARLICALNAYDGSGIPASDARDAFKLLRTIAGNELVEVVWNGAQEPTAEESKSNE